MQDDTIINNLAKLKWACRRGMLELDVLLNKFLNEKYADLQLNDKKRFIDLLSCTDPEIFAWLMGHETPQDPDLLQIVELVRHHARPRL
jgi:antitoxin CptB